MIYDCDPADTISALKAANEDLSQQVTLWKSEFEIARKASHMFEDASNGWMDRALKAEASTSEALQFQLRATRSELEIADGEINRLNGVIAKFRSVGETSIDAYIAIQTIANLPMNEWFASEARRIAKEATT